MTKILMAGLGSIGKRHLRNLRALGVQEIHAWRTRNLPLEDDLAVDRSTSDLNEALAARPDAVFVTNPSSRHLEVANAAARAGCHLFIEKPLSHTLDGIAELNRALAESSLVGMVGFNLRFHPGMQALKLLLEEEAVGRVTSIRAQVGQWLPDWHPDEDYRSGYSARRDLGGGVILDLIHELDYVYHLMGPVAQVGCMAGRLSSLEIDTEDTAEVLLRFHSGAIGSVHLDYVQRVGSRTCTVIGETGTLRLDLIASELKLWRVATGTWETTTFDFDRNDMYLEEARHFLDCIRCGRSATPDTIEGEAVMRIAMAAHEASRTGRTLTDF